MLATIAMHLQSRYYNPKVGRFLNADAFISTGQGFVGNNMFAYCLDNPIRYRDADGEAADSYAGMAGEAIAVFFYELITGDSHPSHQAAIIEQEVLQQQMDMFGNAMGNIWDAYNRGLAIQGEAQRMNAEATLEGWKFLADHPEETVDAGIAFGTATAFIYNVAVGAAMGSKACVIGAALGAAWGLYRGIKGLVEAALD